MSNYKVVFRLKKNYVIVTNNDDIDSFLSFQTTSFLTSVGGVKVSIVAFQAIDPGSIPGWRTFIFSSFRNTFLVSKKLRIII